MNKELLDIYSDYLISQGGHATATGLSFLLNEEISHDRVSRFLRANDYGAKELWHYVKEDVRRQEQSSGGVLLLDDTISERAYTDENAVNGWHYSHAKHRHIKGINLLSCLVRYGDIALPIGYEIIKKDSAYCEIKTKKLKRKASVSKNELFRQLIQQAVTHQVPFDYILTDNWFGAKANRVFIQNTMKKYFILGSKSNRCIVLSLEEAESGQFQQVKSLDWKDGDYSTVYLKNLAFPVKLHKKVFTNEDGSTGILYLVTNDLSIEANRLYKAYQKRWSVEELHKSIKQNASLSKWPTKTVRTQCNHLSAARVAFCKLELLKIKTAINHFAIKNKLLLKANQIMFHEVQKLRLSA